MSSRKKTVAESCKTLSRIFGFRVTSEYANSKIFIVHLRNFYYRDFTERDEALRAYCSIVLTRKRMKEMMSDYYFGKSKLISNEFSTEGPLIPNWYLQSKVASETYLHSDEDSPLLKHLVES